MLRLTSCLLITFSTLQPQVTGLEIMKKLEAQPEPRDVVSKTVLTLTKIMKAKERHRSREITRYEKYFSEGSFLSKSLIRFTKPADVKGTGLLMWEYRKSGKDNDQWLYLPALKKTKRIISNQKNQSFMGSDFTYQDMGGRDIDDDTYTILGEEELFGETCFKVEAKPVEKGIYSRRIIWVEKERSILRKVEFFDGKDKLLKMMTIPEVRKDGDYWTILKMVMENIQKPHKTTLEISDVQYDTGIEEDFFSERFLKRER